MEMNVYKDVTRHSAIGLKCGDVFKIGAGGEAYYLFLEEVYKGPEKEDNYYRLFNLECNKIQEVAIDLLDTQNLYKYKARVEIEDGGDG